MGGGGGGLPWGGGAFSPDTISGSPPVPVPIEHPGLNLCSCMFFLDKLDVAYGDLQASLPLYFANLKMSILCKLPSARVTA